MKRIVNEFLGRYNTTFKLQVKKDQNSYKLPAPIEDSIKVSCGGLALMPYGVCDDYDYRLHDDYIYFSFKFMEYLFNDGSEVEEVSINYNRLVGEEGNSSMASNVLLALAKYRGEV